MQNLFRPLIVNNPCVIGMIHVAALPGTPAYSGKMLPIISNAVEEAEIYLNAGSRKGRVRAKRQFLGQVCAWRPLRRLTAPRISSAA